VRIVARYRYLRLVRQPSFADGLLLVMILSGAYEHHATADRASLRGQAVASIRCEQQWRPLRRIRKDAAVPAK